MKSVFTKTAAMAFVTLAALQSFAGGTVGSASLNFSGTYHNTSSSSNSVSMEGMCPEVLTIAESSDEIKLYGNVKFNRAFHANDAVVINKSNPNTLKSDTGITRLDDDKSLSLGIAKNSVLYVKITMAPSGLFASDTDAVVLCGYLK